MSIYNEPEETSYWLSIGDMMSAILAIFIFFFISQIFSFNSNLKKLGEERDGYRKIIEELDQTKFQIIEKIREELVIDIDKETGNIRLPSEILFSSGEIVLKDEGKMYLKEFIPKYFEVLLGDEDIKKNLSQIIVEGHTDKQGSYLFNLNISQKRALEVVDFIFSSEMGDFKGKNILQDYITANGRSYIDFLGAPGETKNSESRRVEFKFILKEKEAIEKLKDSVKQNKEKLINEKLGEE
ncbi:MAG: OmpA family protein [Cetobacterium sp.]